MVKSDINNREYISGGILTFGIATALVMILDFFFPMISETEAPFLIRLFQGLLVYIFTSAAVGFYVARRASNKHIEVAVKTGYFAFLMNIALMLYYRTFFGALWILAGYLIGGIIGGLTARYFVINEINVDSEKI